MDTLGYVVVSWLRHADCHLKRRPLLLLAVRGIPAKVLWLDTDVLENRVLGQKDYQAAYLVLCTALVVLVYRAGWARALYMV